MNIVEADQERLAGYITDPARRLEAVRQLHSANLRPLQIHHDTTQAVIDVFEMLWKLDLRPFIDDILYRRRRFRPAICEAIKMVKQTIGEPLGIAAATGCALMLDAEMTQAQALPPTDITGQPIPTPIMVIPMGIRDYNSPGKLSAAFLSGISRTGLMNIEEAILTDNQLLKDMLRPSECFFNLVSIVTLGAVRKEVPEVPRVRVQAEGVFIRSLLNYTRLRLDHLTRFGFQ